MTTARIGGCLCGTVRYESAGEPLFSLLCHCRDCQHQSGSAYVAAFSIDAYGDLTLAATSSPIGVAGFSGVAISE